jgi:ferredoxin
MTETQPMSIVRTNTVTPEQVRAALSVFLSKLGAAEAAAAHTCVRCGLCADSCHYYLSERGKVLDAGLQVNLVLSVSNAIHPDRRLFPDWWEPGIWTRACWRSGWTASSDAVPCAVDARSTVLPASTSPIWFGCRSAMAAIGLVPTELQSTVNAAVEVSGKQHGDPPDRLAGHPELDRRGTGCGSG